MLWKLLEFKEADLRSAIEGEEKMRESYTFESKDRHSEIHAVRWVPDSGKVRGVLQIVHGMQEYIERYEPFALWLNERGIAVFGHDHIGHGESVRGPEEWGIMSPEHPADIMVEDIFRNYQLGKEKWPGSPFFLLGHSMGSYLVRMFLGKKAGDLDGLDGAIVMGTGSLPDSSLRFGLAVLKLIAAFRGWNYRSSLVQKLSFSGPYQRYDLSGRDSGNSWLTKDQEIVKKYYADPKCTYLFSLGAYRGLMEACYYDNRPEHLAKIRRDLPLLLVSGAEDPVGDLGKGVERVRGQYAAAGFCDLRMKLYENDRHEILNETDREQVYEDLWDWMQEHGSKINSQEQ